MSSTSSSSSSITTKIHSIHILPFLSPTVLTQHSHTNTDTLTLTTEQYVTILTSILTTLHYLLQSLSINELHAYIIDNTAAISKLIHSYLDVNVYEYIYTLVNVHHEDNVDENVP